MYWATFVNMNKILLLQIRPLGILCPASWQVSLKKNNFIIVKDNIDKFT